MGADTMEAALRLIADITAETGQQSVKVTFHGGEPLMAGHAIVRQALNSLESRFGQGGYEVGLQSNLWLLDDEFCELLAIGCIFMICLVRQHFPPGQTNQFTRIKTAKRFESLVDISDFLHVAL